MADRIKGITVVIGGDTTGLDKALAGTNKEIRDTQKQLKDVERLLKLDPTNTTLLEQRQRLLGDAVQQTKTKLDTLKKAEKQVQEQFERGKVSQAQYDALQREIADTQLSLNKVEKEAQEAAVALNKVDEKSLDDVADAAQDAGRSLDKATEEAAGFGDVLKAGALVEGVKALAGAVGDIVDETAEYRKAMGTLETSSEAAGYTAEQTNEAFARFYGALGDTQTAATATANLQALNLSQRDLKKLLDLTVGAWATYGDSIPIDGLAESINETVRAGQVTGTFADVLNWGSREGETFGVMLKANTEANKEWNEAVAAAETAEDYFNLALQDASSEAERANIVMQAMASQGLADTADAWYRNNEDIVKANDAQLQFSENAAEMAERVAPAQQAVKEGANQLFQVFLDATSEIDFEALSTSIGKVFDAVSNLFTFLIEHREEVGAVLLTIATGLAALKLQSLAGDLAGVISGTKKAAETFPLLSGAISTLTNPVFLVTTAVVGLVALIATKGDEIQAMLQKIDDFLQGVFATDWTTIFGPVLGEALNTFFANVKNIWDGIKKVFDGIIDFIRGVFTGDWQRAWDGVKQIFGGIWDSFTALAKAPINAIIGLINGLIGAINSAINGLNRLKIDVPDWVPGIGGKKFGFNIPNIPNIPYLAKGGILSSGSAIVGEAGPELLTMMGTRAMVQPLTSQTRETNLGGVSITVYGAPGQNVQQLADIIMDRMQSAVRQKGAVFGA